MWAPCSISVPAMANNRGEYRRNPLASSAGGTGLHPTLHPSARVLSLPARPCVNQIRGMPNSLEVNRAAAGWSATVKQRLRIDRFEVLRARAHRRPHDVDQFPCRLIGCLWDLEAPRQIPDAERAAAASAGHGAAFAHDRPISLADQPRDLAATPGGAAGTARAELRFSRLRSFGQMWFIPSGQACSSVT